MDDFCTNSGRLGNCRLGVLLGYFGRSAEVLGVFFYLCVTDSWRVLNLRFIVYLSAFLTDISWASISWAIALYRH